MVRNVRLAYGLKSRHDWLRESGYLTAGELAARLDIKVSTVKAWRAKEWVRAAAYDDKPHYLYAPPGWARGDGAALLVWWEGLG